jgi:serine/threonine-protein kinase
LPACEATVFTLTKAGRYEIREELGRGAMGVVYRAHDPVIGRDVAVKTMHLSEAGTGLTREDLVNRFQTEARAAGLLTHPNIVVVYDAGEEEGVFYITMELVEGRSLQTLIDLRQTFPLPRVMRLMEQACSALDFAHQRNVVHRDIKPANLMLTEDDTLKITDFGTAKILQFGTAQTAHVMGTPSYMSPEQVKGKPVDGRSDIFSLGVILYELMTGEKPFPGENITTVIYKIINEEPISPRALDSSIHPGLSTVVTHALAKDPAARFQTCHELLDALKNYRDMVSPEATVRIAPERTPSIAAQGSPGWTEPTPAPNGAAYVPAAISEPPLRPVFGAMQVEEPPKKRRSLLLVVILLAIIGYAGYRISPPVMDVWQRMHEPEGAPPILRKMVPATPVTNSETPGTKSGAIPPSASAQALAQDSAQAAAPQAIAAPAEPAASVPSVVSTAEKLPVPQKPAPPAESPAANSLKKRLGSELAGLLLADKVKMQVTGSTLRLSGRLSPKEHGELLARLRNVPAGVYVVDDIQYTEVANAATPEPKDAGWAWVRSTPPGAQISVDGRETGLRTPARVAMPHGDHDILLTLPGFANAHRTVLMRTGENLEFTEVLDRP